MKTLFRRLFVFCSELSAFEWLTIVLFLLGLVIQTFGRVSGVLRPLALCGAVLWLLATGWAFLQFSRAVREDLGAGWFRLFWVVCGIQFFWAIVRAPLDVDGIFYHLTIALDALQKNQWGDWQFKIWQVQSTPKVSEVLSLCLIALGGFRWAQLAHFSTAILGAWAFWDIARSLGLRRPALFGLIYWLTPIVNKQMTTNYVDMAFYSFWLACAAFAMRAVLRSRTRDVWFLGFSAFLLVGCKMNGFVSLAAIAPILGIGFFGSDSKSFRWKWILGSLTFFAAISAAFWMIPNAIAWNGNPVFPLQPAALFSGGALKLVPPEIPITGLNGWLGGVVAPDPVRWFLQFLIFTSCEILNFLCVQTT